MQKPPQQIIQKGRRAGQISAMIATLSYGRLDPLRVVVWGPNGRLQARVRLGVLKLQPKPRLP